MKTNNFIPLTFFVLLTIQGYTQPVKDSLELSNPIDSLVATQYTNLSTDYNGQLYMVESSGDLVKKADPELRYSPVRQSKITILNTWNPLRLFLFYEDLQEYVLLDRFLTESARYELSGLSGYIGLCAPSLNNQIWAVDMNDISLKKYDPQTKQILITIPLRQILDPEKSDFFFLSEYKNYLFLSDRNQGMYVFDNLGNFLRLIIAPEISHPGFLKDEIYYLQDNTLHFENIFSGERHEIILKNTPEDLLLTNEGLWLVRKGKILCYSF